MKRILYFFVSTLIFNYCNAQYIGNNKIEENSFNFATIQNSFDIWKNSVIADSSFLFVCPKFEDFEKMNEKRAEKLANANIFPKNVNISYGNFNDDYKIDALISFKNNTCYSNYSGRVAPNSYNSSYYSLLITSTFDSYESSNILKFNEIKKAIQNELNASRIEISLTEIKDVGVISGRCIIWNHFDDEDFLGLCCPNNLMYIDIDINENKIYVYLDELNNIFEIDY